MRFALWILAIFAAAVGMALFARQSSATLTLFWPPHRIDLSLNLALVLLAALFALLYLALRAFIALAELPERAKAWRRSQRQDAMHHQLRDAMTQLLAGRYTRAKKHAMQAQLNAKALADTGEDSRHVLQVQSLALLIAAEVSQTLQDAPERDRLLQDALELPLPKSDQHFKEGIILRSARWMLEENDPISSLQRLATLSQGAQRRTLALRLKLKASQQAKQIHQALETARLLAKHGGFSASLEQTLLRSLAINRLSQAHDAEQIARAWLELTPSERAQPEVATHAALRLLRQSPESPQTPDIQELARDWLEPIWKSYPQLGENAQVQLVRALEASFAAANAQLDQKWFTQIEAAHLQLPHDPRLQYLVGMACLRSQLWGKAQQHLSASVAQLKDASLQTSAWRSLGQLAEQRGDPAAALAAWKNAAQSV